MANFFQSLLNKFTNKDEEEMVDKYQADVQRGIGKIYPNAVEPQFQSGYVSPSPAPAPNFMESIKTNVRNVLGSLFPPQKAEGKIISPLPPETSTPQQRPTIPTSTPTPTPAPPSLPQKDIENLIVQTFPSDPDTALGVAFGESSFNPQGRNTIPERGIDAIGIMQINLPAHLDKVPGATYEEKARNLMDPRINLEVAKQIYSIQGWQPWEAFTNNSYRRYRR